MGRRAEQVGATRQRIVDAAVLLHGTVGPAATSIAAIAERAGVTRLTVYRHFPDETALFAACSRDWLARQPLPRPEEWALVADPVDRLRSGLADLYRFYRSGAPMLALVYRDHDSVPAPIREMREAAEQRQVEMLASAFADRSRRKRRLRRALTAHAAAFTTWRSLCEEQGLTDKEAVTAMTALVTELV